MTAPQSLIEHFSRLEDPRVERNRKHELMDVIVLCVCAVVSGAEGWSDIEEFGRAKLDWLRRYVPLANGVPVDDTIARIISALSVSGFQDCFTSWMEDVVEFSGGEIIAVDGKAHRRSHDHKKGVKALHMVSAWACRNQLVLGQVKTQEKSNEITAVPELLERLELSGCIVTVDAMGCQREIATQVRAGGGDYVLPVKGNQGTLEKEVRAYFDAAEEDDFLRPEIEDEATSEEGHGRVEHRSYFLSTDLGSLTVGERWPDLKAIGMVESERYSRDGVSIERRYFITSVDDIELFHQAVRSYWGIENGLHWRLDVTFREDESRIRRGDAAHNLGVIRHVALNLLKSESSKISVRKKRIRAGYNDHYRSKVLMGR
ncbi:MAG: ISAs1 family transposase [Dehalococcoidia bacterium]|nr:ISAs1 family transposase [Dehalococcoidia bacterium]